MDVSRAVLDNLMGRDRNKTIDNITERDHYSNPDVCKSFLVCFCFNTLFPNTTYDEGPCQKRHDTYLKTMFDSDPNRAQYERQYIRECIHWIERRLQDVEKKHKQNQAVIDNKSNFPTDRPRQTIDRIIAIDQDISRLITDSLKYGQEGKIDDSLRCVEQVEKLRQRKKQIQSMGSDMSSTQKQQKICGTCGAIQTINDTQKRIQTHLEGKIHQGFLKLRHQVEVLKIKLEVLNKLNPPQRKQREDHDRKRQQSDKRKQSNQQKPKQSQKQNQRIPQSRQTREERQQRQRNKSDSESKRKKRDRSREKQKDRRQRHEDKERRRDSRQRDRRSRSKNRKDRKDYWDSNERAYKQRNHKQTKQHKREKKSKKNRSKSKDKNYEDQR